MAPGAMNDRTTLSDTVQMDTDCLFTSFAHSIGKQCLVFISLSKFCFLEKEESEG
jgi:hypothetical protein